MYLSESDKMILFCIDVIFPCILAAVFIILAIRRARRYYVKEEVTGEIIWTLKQPQEMMAKKLGGYGLLLAAAVYRLMNPIGDGFSGIFFTVAMAVIFISGMMTSTLSQKVCEKGILDSKGFIPWEEIRKVNASAENDEEVVVRLKRSYDNTLKIYCQKGMALEIEGYIRERITE